MKYILYGAALSVLLTGSMMGASPLTPEGVAAQDSGKKQACEGSGGHWEPPTDDEEAKCVSEQGAEEVSIPDIINKVINLLLSIAGAVAVIMLIIGGFRYVISGGDSSAIEGAKNTILYAIIGLVVIFLSFAAVNFVISNLT